jgi:hypothetical protein
MKRRVIKCEVCGHGRSYHYDPVRNSDRDILCRAVAACRCKRTQRQIEIDQVVEREARS